VATLAEFAPLRAESVDTIRARVDAGVNAGLDPVDPRWTDTTPGGFFWDHTQVLSLEAELLWDFASTELPASFFLPFSWGIYLDYWGELLGVGRKDEARAIGEVTFTNTTAVDVPVGTGAEVAATTADPDAEPLVFTTTGSAVAPALGEVSVAVQAEDPGSQYNVAPGAVSLILSTLEGLTVTNAAAMSSGADVEADEAYKARLLVEFSSARGGGTREDYIAGALARPGVGGVVVEPRWAGPGTVRLVLTDANGQALSGPAVAIEQEYWDPASAPGTGLGAAPINHLVTVATVAVLTPTIKLWLQLAAGYTITAEAGKEDISAAISAAVWAFERALAAGDDVLLNRVREAALKVPGVYDVPQVHINAVLANYAVTALQIARPGTVTLTTDAP
jgi:uncharacterized phage protein gp47/JayE